MKHLGIMQGRLLPQFLGRYQAFPKEIWPSEFYMAKQLGFSAIEFILDYEDSKSNPLLQDEGIEEIQKTIIKTGTKVHSICADYFMEAPFHSDHQEKSEDILGLLISNARKIGVKDIVIPCVDQSSLKSDLEKKQLAKSLETYLPIAEKAGIFLNLETDLNPKDFKVLLENMDNHAALKVNYDTGNSASLGYNPEEEFKAYGNAISLLHIKDRNLNSGSVNLGTGNVDFQTIISLLKSQQFSGTITLQASRQKNYLSDLIGVQEQAKFIHSFLDQL